MCHIFPQSPPGGPSEAPQNAPSVPPECSIGLPGVCQRFFQSPTGPPECSRCYSGVPPGSPDYSKDSAECASKSFKGALLSQMTDRLAENVLNISQAFSSPPECSSCSIMRREGCAQEYSLDSSRGSLGVLHRFFNSDTEVFPSPRKVLPNRTPRRVPPEGKGKGPQE